MTMKTNHFLYSSRVFVSLLSILISSNYIAVMHLTLQKLLKFCVLKDVMQRHAKHKDLKCTNLFAVCFNKHLHNNKNAK